MTRDKAEFSAEIWGEKNGRPFLYRPTEAHENFWCSYVAELFVAALVAAAFGQRWRWAVGVVMILTLAQALVYLAAYPSDPLILLGIVVASGIVSGGAVTGVFFRRIWR